MNKQQVDFVRFSATDDVELQGWLSDVAGETAVLHVHGRSGNGYENYFLDNLREMYVENGISFFSIDTRGRGIISDFRQGDSWKLAGSCFELFEESEYDIQGAVDYLKSIGKSRFILQGHSIGSTKVINYYLQKSSEEIYKIVLIAPTDMTGWVMIDPKHEEYLETARKLLAQGKGEELVGAQCLVDKSPLSAQTYPTICEKGSKVDVYGEREGGALLGRIDIPILIPYGSKDIGITEVDGTIEKWIERVDKIKNDNTKIAVVQGAEHGFRGYETELAKIVEEFLDDR
jgi:alpha-beta hydrolase superfamily lysophospholipase